MKTVLVYNVQTINIPSGIGLVALKAITGERDVIVKCCITRKVESNLAGLILNHIAILNKCYYL